MARTFLVTLDNIDHEDPDVVAEDILDSLVGDSFYVQSVRPWASPGEAEQTQISGAPDFSSLPRA